MASSKVMASSKPRNSDLSTSSPRSRRASASSSPPPPLSATKPAPQSLSHSQPPSDFMIGSNNSRDLTPSMPSPSPTMTVDGILRNVYATNPSSESTLLDAQITLIDSVLPPQSIETSSNGFNNNNNNSSGQDTGSVVSVFPQSSGKTVDDVWREIVAGRKEMKEETDEMMTLEDFLVKAGAVDVGGEGGGEEDEVKMPQTERLSGGVFAFDTVPPESAFQVLDKVEGSIIGFGNEMDLVAGGSGVGGGGRGKRGRAPVLEPLDKAAQQRQKRMIKNRESAARSRERKQAYQVELESLAVRLEEENEQLLKEKEERTRKRFKQLMEQIVPVVEKRRPPRVLRRIHSWRW